MKRLIAALGICFATLTASVPLAEAGTCENQCHDYYLTCSLELCGGRCADCVEWYNLCLDRCL
jgi:hypothetical protein